MTTYQDRCELTLDTVLRHALDGMFVIDRNRQVVFFSEGCERITGADRGSVLGTPCACYESMDCSDEQGRRLSGMLCPALKVLRGDIGTARQRMRIRHADGKGVWVEVGYSPVYGTGGEVDGVLGIMRDITETKAREDELRDAAGQMNPYEPSTIYDGAGAAGADGGDVLQETSSDMGSLDRILTSIEKREILAALKRADGQRTRAARMLGISRSRLYRRMEALGIDPRELSSAREVHPSEDV